MKQKKETVTISNKHNQTLLINNRTENCTSQDLENHNISGKRKRRAKSNSKLQKNYFTQETEDAIIEFNKSTDLNYRNELYNTKIKFAFEKIAENIFNTFKFSYCDSTPINIQQEVVSHLISNIHKFKSGKGKAFSYFSIVAKNYLIAHNNTNYKSANKHVNISDTVSEDTVCLQVEDEYYSDVQNKELVELIINYWEEHVTKVFTKPKDLNIAYAVIELLRNCDRIENFNKKTLYLLIREISDCKTQQITKILSKMKVHQKTIMKHYYDNGTLD